MIDRDIIENFIEFCSEHLDTDMMKYWDSQYYPQDTHLLLDAYENYLSDGEADKELDFPEDIKIALGEDEWHTFFIENIAKGKQ